MNDLIVKHVDLFGDDIIAAQDREGNIWAGISCFCRGIGLNKNEKDRQVKNVQSDLILKKGCAKFDAGVFDANNTTVALRIDYLPLWLAKISITPNMIESNPELADKLLKYQLKAKDVLADAFLGKKKVPQTYLEALKDLVAIEEEKEQLKLELDRSKDWYSIKRVAALNGVSWKTFDWRRLKNVGHQMGYEVRKIFDANYGEVNVYHKEVWEAAYPKYEI